MRVEIVRELDPEDDKLEIPWADPNKPELRYADLKAHPEDIARLEECRHHPALARLLDVINSPESCFRSAKCDAWTTTDLTEDERADFGLPHKAGSYVDLVFDLSRFHSELDRHVQLGEEIRQALVPLRVQAQMEICVRRCLYHPEERWGYYLTLFVHAYGATPAEAESEWTRALRALGDALSRISATLLRTLRELDRRGLRP